MPPVQPEAEPRRPRDAESFVREHQAVVWRYLRLLGASAADADDLLQETFLRVLRRPGPPVAASTAIAVLRTIARGLWIDRHRWLQRRRLVRWADELDENLAATGDAEHEPWLDALSVCRSKLTERAQLALDLAYRDGRGRHEVARELGLAPNTVRNLLAAARDVLKQCIEKRLRDAQEERR